MLRCKLWAITASALATISAKSSGVGQVSAWTTGLIGSSPTESPRIGLIGSSSTAQPLERATAAVASMCFGHSNKWREDCTTMYDPVNPTSEQKVRKELLGIEGSSARTPKAVSGTI